MDERLLLGNTKGTRGYFCRLPDLKELSDLYRTLSFVLIFAVDDAIRRSAGSEVEQIAARFEAESGIAPTPAEAAGLARAELVESALGQVVALADNRVMSKLADNVIARTHVVRLLDMESLDSFRAFSTALHDLTDSVRRSDRQAAGRLITNEIEKKIKTLPNLIREFVARRYMFEGMEGAVSKSA